MKITYDREADAAYIQLLPPSDDIFGWVKKTYPCDVRETGHMINLDFTADGRLGGIEILDGSKVLPKPILDAAEIIG